MSKDDDRLREVFVKLTEQPEQNNNGSLQAIDRQIKSLQSQLNKWQALKDRKKELDGC